MPYARQRVIHKYAKRLFMRNEELLLRYSLFFVAKMGVKVTQSSFVLDWSVQANKNEHKNHQQRRRCRHKRSQRKKQMQLILIRFSKWNFITRQHWSALLLEKKKNLPLCRIHRNSCVDANSLFAQSYKPCHTWMPLTSIISSAFRLITLRFVFAQFRTLHLIFMCVQTTVGMPRVDQLCVL